MMVEKPCPVCHKDFRTSEAAMKQGRGKFCSFGCAIKGRRVARTRLFGKDNPNWKGGISLDPYGYFKITSQRYPDHLEAREQTKYAIKAGRLVRQPCEICGSEHVQAHHDDYSQPLKVRWLCTRHHADYHRGKRRT